MKTVAYLETDETGEIQWSEGCICQNNVYPHSIELVAKLEVIGEINLLQERIKKLEKQVSDYGWAESAKHAQATGSWM